MSTDFSVTGKTQRTTLPKNRQFLQRRPKYVEAARTTSTSTTLWWITFVWLRAAAAAGCASARRTSATWPRTSASTKTWSSSRPSLWSFSSETFDPIPDIETKPKEKTTFFKAAFVPEKKQNLPKPSSFSVPSFSSAANLSTTNNHHHHRAVSLHACFRCFPKRTLNHFFRWKVFAVCFFIFKIPSLHENVVPSFDGELYTLHFGMTSPRHRFASFAQKSEKNEAESCKNESCSFHSCKRIRICPETQLFLPSSSSCLSRSSRCWGPSHQPTFCSFDFFISLRRNKKFEFYATPTEQKERKTRQSIKLVRFFAQSSFFQI